MKRNIILIACAIVLAAFQTSTIVRVYRLEAQMKQASIAMEKSVLVIVDQITISEGLNDLGFKQTLAIDLLQQTDSKLFQGIRNNTEAIVKNHYQ